MFFKKVYSLTMLLLPLAAMAQESVNYSAEATAVVSSQSSTPLFFSANRQGVVSPRSNAAYLRGAMDYTWQQNDFRFKAALDLVATTSQARDYYKNCLHLQQIYAEAAWKKLELSVGQREENPMLVNPVLSSGNMVWSGNARPIPQVKLGTTDFVTVPGTGGWLNFFVDVAYGRQFDGNYNEAVAESVDKAVEKRHFNTIENAYFHRKNIFLRSKKDAPLVFTIGVEHVAQFGGEINGVEAPAGGKDFIGVMFAKKENSTQWQYNHLASLDMRADVNTKVGTFSGYVQLFMDEICEEGAPRQNGADGLWGLEWKAARPGWIDNVVFEYMQTTNGNGNVHADEVYQYNGKEYHYYGGNYNDDQLYGAWANYGLNVGTPLMKSPAYNDTRYPGCTASIVRAFHLGAKGNITTGIDYRLLMSYHKSWGTFTYLLPEAEDNFSCMLEASYKKNGWSVTPALAFDSGKLYGNNVGLMVSVKKTGNLIK